MCVREKTCITLWTGSLRKEETCNVNLQLIKSRHIVRKRLPFTAGCGWRRPSSRLAVCSRSEALVSPVNHGNFLRTSFNCFDFKSIH